VPGEKVSPANSKLRGFKTICLWNLRSSPARFLAHKLVLEVVRKPFSQQWKVGHCWALWEDRGARATPTGE